MGFHRIHFSAQLVSLFFLDRINIEYGYKHPFGYHTNNLINCEGKNREMHQSGVNR